LDPKLRASDLISGSFEMFLGLLVDRYGVVRIENIGQMKEN
jgi:hypothetical protein